MDARILLNEIKTMQAEIALVFICHPETKKIVEEATADHPNVYIIEEVNAEPNTVFMVKDLDLKKALIESYESRKEQK